MCIMYMLVSEFLNLQIVIQVIMVLPFWTSVPGFCDLIWIYNIVNWFKLFRQKLKKNNEVFTRFL